VCEGENANPICTDGIIHSGVLFSGESASIVKNLISSDSHFFNDKKLYMLLFPAKSLFFQLKAFNELSNCKHFLFVKIMQHANTTPSINILVFFMTYDTIVNNFSPRKRKIVIYQHLIQN